MTVVETVEQYANVKIVQEEENGHEVSAKKRQCMTKPTEDSALWNVREEETIMKILCKMKLGVTKKPTWGQCNKKAWKEMNHCEDSARRNRVWRRNRYEGSAKKLCMRKKSLWRHEYEKKLCLKAKQTWEQWCNIKLWVKKKPTLWLFKKKFVHEDCSRRETNM